MIHPASLYALLLASQNPVTEWSKQFRNRQAGIEASHVILALVTLAVLILVFWLLAQLVERRERSNTIDSPFWLFHSLCKAHALIWQEGLLLWRVARFQELKDPARLFVEPDRIKPDKVGPILRAHASTLESLGRRLFAGLTNDQSNSKDAIRVESFDSPGFPVVTQPTLDVPPWAGTSTS